MQIDQERLIQLVRASILERDIDAALFNDMTQSDWKQLLDCASCHGVVSLCYNALENSDICPPIDVSMDWMGQALFREQRYQEQKEAAKQLCAYWRKEGFEMIVLKGLAIAQLYPNPVSREFGDLDVSTVGDHEKAVEAIKSLGIKVELEDKHDVFDYSGVHVEHHKHFVSDAFQSGKVLNDYLLRISDRNKFKRSEDGWLIPDADFNVIFLLRHMARHLASEGMTLKQVLDYGVLLLKEGDKIHWTEAKAVLKESKMDIAFDTMIGVCERILDVDFSGYHIDSPGEQMVSTVIDDVMDARIQSKSQNVIVRTFEKTRRLFSRKWVYDIGLIPDHFWTETVFGSIIDHLKHPKFF